MALKYKQLTSMTDKEIIENLDNLGSVQNGKTLRENHESYRNELFRRDTIKLNKTMVRLTWVIAFFTFINLVFVVISVTT